MKISAAAVCLVAIHLPALAQISCQKVGEFTYCSDGTTVQRNGDFTYVTPPPALAPTTPASPPGISAADAFLEAQRESQQRSSLRAQEQQQAQNSKPTDVEMREMVQAAVERNPKLKEWRVSNPALWNRAREVDAVMRRMDENKGLSFDARFEKVVRFVEAEQAANK